MRAWRRLGLLLICLTAGAVTLTAADDGGRPLSIRLRVADRARLDELSRLVSITDVRGTEVEAEASPRQLARLAAAGFTWTVRSVEAAAAPVMCPAGWEYDTARSWNCYPGYNQYVGLLAFLAATHPTLCRLEAIGDTNNQVRHHRLWALRITDNPDLEEDEPEVLLTAAMHGDEASGTVLLLRLAAELLGDYGSDPDISGLVDLTEIWINPAANPDGTYFEGDDTLAGAVRSYTTVTGQSTDVDPNRNFPDPDPALGDHPDGTPWWPETAAMMRFAREHSITLSANLHDGSEVVNYPWDTWPRPHPDEGWFVSLARAWADRAHADGPPGYMTDLDDGITNGYAWYPVHGGRQDYMTYFQSAREVTVELTHVKTPPGDLLPELWQANRRALLGFIAAAGEGIRGLVRAPDGAPLAATVELVGHDTAADRSTVRTDPDVGDYHRLLLPGVYTVRISASGYQPLEMGGISVTAGAPTLLDATLEPEPPATVSGRVSDAVSGLPIAGAAVEVEGGGPSGTTAPDGSYTIPDVPVGQRAFRVSAPGYVAADADAEVTGPATTLDVALRPRTLRPTGRIARGPGATAHGQAQAAPLP